MNVSRILAPGGLFRRVSRGSEALGRSRFRQAMAPGGSAKENPSRAWGDGGDHMSSSDVGSYEFKRSPWELL